MGYRNVWEIKVRTTAGTFQRYIGKSKLIGKYVEWLRVQADVVKVESRKLTDEERRQIPFSMIMG